MKLYTKISLFVLLVGAGEMITALLGQTADPQVRTQLAVDSVNGKVTEQVMVRSYEWFRSASRIATFVGYCFVGVILFVPRNKTK